MRWALNNKNAEKEREDFERFGQEIPASLFPPELKPGAESIYHAFWDLCTDRQSGMSISRISYSSARLYCQGWNDDDFALFWRLIRAMDTVYIDHSSGEDKEKTFTREAFRGAFSSK